MTVKKKTANKVEYYKDKKGLWRWRVISSNHHNILADSGQGYKRKFGAKKGFTSVIEKTPVA